MSAGNRGGAAAPGVASSAHLPQKRRSDDAWERSTVTLDTDTLDTVEHGRGHRRVWGGSAPMHTEEHEVPATQGRRIGVQTRAGQSATGAAVAHRPGRG